MCSGDALAMTSADSYPAHARIRAPYYRLRPAPASLLPTPPQPLPPPPILSSSTPTRPVITTTISPTITTNTSTTTTTTTTATTTTTTTTSNTNIAAPAITTTSSAAVLLPLRSKQSIACPSPPVTDVARAAATTTCSATSLPPSQPPRLPPSSPPASQFGSATSPRPVDKVESVQRASEAASKLKAHARLASFGRHRLRGIVSTVVSDPASQGETLPRVPVSPSDTSSHHKRSDVSSHSNTSSETALTDDSKSDLKSLSDDSRPSIHDTATWLDKERVYDAERDLNEYESLLRRSPRMMHQTSSKLLRMTEDERPFTRDFKDLFSTLMVSLPLSAHRVRFTKIEHTFTTEEATTNLGSLKFSQSNRMPDPKDPSRIVTTTTTTTFSMAKEMARSVCQRFLEARFIESVDGKTDFQSKGSVWQLTPKGMHILSRFCQRNGIHQRHVNDLLDSPRNMMSLVILERDSVTDQIQRDIPTVNVIFRRFAGDTGPNLKPNSTASDSELTSDYATGLMGVKMQRSRRGDKVAPYVFTGKCAFDWLMDCCTTVDRREVTDIGLEFIRNGLIEPIGDERQNGHQVERTRFSASRNALYAVTNKGMRVAGWVTTPNGTVNGTATASQRVPSGVVRDSNTNRMTVIIRDPALRLLFSEYLRETHCDENLSFYVEVKFFLSEYDRAKHLSGAPKPDTIRETLASAYSLYNAFLAPGSPCELNIDHNLRNALASRMTRAVGEDEQMIQSLDEVAVLFDQAQSSVFKLMASDSVPKFSREPKYAAILKERNMESLLVESSSISAKS